MIKFFRKIRQRLLTENKFSKYFLYAIGEIFLVVIGILIALQINNWKEEKQLSNSEHLYLESLNTEFIENLKEINKAIHSNNVIVGGFKQLLIYFNTSDIQDIKEKNISIALWDALNGYAIYAPTEGVLTEMINSGKIKILKNSKLRQQLSSYNQFQIELKFQEESIKERKMSGVLQIVIDHGSIKRIIRDINEGDEILGVSDSLLKEPFSNKKLFELRKLENEIIVIQGYSVYLTDFFYTLLKSKIEGILKSIEKELEK